MYCDSTRTLYTVCARYVWQKISLKLCGVNQLKEGGCQQFVSSSGGNAGVAAACVSKATGIPCTVFVPEWAQPACINLIRDNGAQVQVHATFCLTRILIKVLPVNYLVEQMEGKSEVLKGNTKYTYFFKRRVLIFLIFTLLAKLAYANRSIKSFDTIWVEGTCCLHLQDCSNWVQFHTHSCLHRWQSVMNKWDRPTGMEAHFASYLFL